MTTYTVNCYALDDLTTAFHGLTATDAMNAADTFVAQHCLGAAHILRTDSTSGIYVARPQDLARSTFEQRLAQLERKVWG